MVAELHFLHILLVVGMVVAPMVTSRFFLENTNLHDAVYSIALGVTTTGLLFDVPILTFAWLLFCVFGFSLFLRERFAFLRSIHELAKGVPFVFSIIAATWLVSGSNGFGLLGYEKAFSYYAALHSHFLGWTLVGGIAFLANESPRFRQFHLAAVYVCLVSFLLVAFGIDGVPVIKPVGVFGLTVAMSASMILFLVSMKKTSTLGFVLGLVSFVAFVFTMTLAWQNEFGFQWQPLWGTRAMVSFHGVVNGFIVAPFFVLAIYFGVSKRDATDT